MSSVLQVADSESGDSDSSEEEFFEVFFSVFEPLGSQQGHRKRKRRTYRRDITRTANNCTFYEIYLRSPTRYSDPVNLKQFRNRFRLPWDCFCHLYELCAISEEFKHQGSPDCVC